MQSAMDLKGSLHYFKAQAMKESFSCKVSCGIPFPLEGLGQIVWTSCDQVLLLVAACRDFSTQSWGGDEAEALLSGRIWNRGCRRLPVCWKSYSSSPLQGCERRIGHRVSLADTVASNGSGVQALCNLSVVLSYGVIYESQWVDLTPSSLLEAVIWAVGLRFLDFRTVSESVLQRDLAAGKCKDALTLGTSCSPLFLPPWKPLLSPLLC